MKLPTYKIENYQPTKVVNIVNVTVVLKAIFTFKLEGVFPGQGQRIFLSVLRFKVLLASNADSEFMISLWKQNCPEKPVLSWDMLVGVLNTGYREANGNTEAAFLCCFSQRCRDLVKMCPSCPWNHTIVAFLPSQHFRTVESSVCFLQTLHVTHEDVETWAGCSDLKLWPGGSRSVIVMELHRHPAWTSVGCCCGVAAEVSHLSVCFQAYFKGVWLETHCSCSG